MRERKVKSGPCSRCGQPRKPGRKQTSLCNDCKYVMTTREVNSWEKKRAA